MQNEFKKTDLKTQELLKQLQTEIKILESMNFEV